VNQLPRACDIGKRNKLDPRLRRWLLTSAAIFAFIGLVAGCWVGYGIVSAADIKSPLIDKLFLNSFIAVSAAAAGMIFGAFVGSTLYRFMGNPPKE
jgi:membrane associated rhomboid family serine protease